MIKTSFITGEVSPSLFGHVDLARYAGGASTLRNCFVSYRGGAYSRAGTKFVGFSKQTGRSYPPRVLTFQFSINQGLMLEFGNNYMRVVANGAFVTESPINIAALSQANPAVLQTASDAFVTGDWVYLAGVGGMTPVNGETYVLIRTSASHYTLHDVYGNNIDTTGFPAYTGGGTASRIYTLSTIYSEVDLLYLKFTQSADVMSLCLVNQLTGTEYAPQDLNRVADDEWTFTPVVASPTITPPATVNVTSSTSGTTDYRYVVTSVNPDDGTESIASPQAHAATSVDVASTAGSLTLTWSNVPGASPYNVYKAQAAYGGALVPTGALYGFAGQAYGLTFIDSNVVPDFTQVPPTHQNPFARGQIIGVPITAGGTGYTTIGYTITTATGSGAVLQLITASNVLVGVYILDPGENYLPGDTIAITGAGTGATATLTIGPETGTYPGVVSYFQERRGYAFTLNNPDTYWFSQPGSFTNFDFRIPTIDSDAITGSPWSVEVNGIQWMIETTGGLLVFTGLQTWLLVGAGSFATNVQPLSPSSQLINPQPEIGCSPTLFPIKINYDVLFADASSSYYYDQPYQLYALSEPIDITENSAHLFTGHSFVSHAWCRRPYKLLWTVRDDGVMLSLTYLKSEQVIGWGRHDTNGLFVSVCSVVEPPVDALYAATQRFPGSNAAYMIERMDNRIWSDVENTWCVDCALSLPQPTPNATLFASSATGLGAITGGTILAGGQNFSSTTTGAIVDQPMAPNQPVGPGAGAVPTLTFTAGVLTAISFSGGNQGAGYLNPKLVLTDPANTGSGESVTLTLNNTTTFVANAAVFALGDVGKVIRMGGGIAVVTQYLNSGSVLANILSPIVATVPDRASTPLFQGAGNWTLTAPVTTIGGLGYLAGATVTGLADGNVIPPTVVPSSGTINLPAPISPNVTGATAVTVGLGFRAQAQTVYLDAGTPTIQGQRKKIAAATARIEASRGLKMGSNQPDGSTQSPMQIEVSWNSLNNVPDDGPNFPLKAYNALCTPLRTGDIRIPVGGGWATPGQVALQQDSPLPMQILSLEPELFPGDTPQTQAPKRQQGRSA